MSLSLQCVSVSGGWQSAIKGTEVTFGPVYNRIQDLWVWQRNNIFGVLQNESNN